LHDVELSVTRRECLPFQPDVSHEQRRLWSSSAQVCSGLLALFTRLLKIINF
jgi:hypothetical protein